MDLTKDAWLISLKRSNMLHKWKVPGTCFDNQYRKPKGLIGTYIGEMMVRQHKPETVWTIKLFIIQQSKCFGTWMWCWLRNETYPRQL
jgi:hypothetical protein